MAQTPEVYDPQRALVEDWRSFFMDHRDHRFVLECIEGPVEIPGNWMLLNIMLMMPLIKRRRPISTRFLKLSGIYDAAEHARVETMVSQALEDYGYTREQLGHDIISTVMDAHNMCYTHLGSEICTMDIFSIAETVLQEGVREACTPDYGDVTDRNIKRMETLFREQSAKVLELLSGDTLDYNVFRAALKCGALKAGQFVQFVLSAGPRTDTNENIFLKPVRGSFLSGMYDIHELALESRSASKANHYNKSQMSTTQYQNRKIHLQNSAMRYLYEGDCGSTVYLTYTITEKTKKYYLGKFFVRGPQLVELTEELLPEVVGKTVQMRDVPGCRYADGYCETCGGTITRSFSRKGNVGFVSNVNTGAPVAQQVLSTKHLISTDAAEYEVPLELRDVLISSTNVIFLHSDVRKYTDTMTLGFLPRDLSKLTDLKHCHSKEDIQASRFSDIKYMFLGRMREDGTIERMATRTHMGGETKTFPHLSPEVLDVIRRNPEDISVQNGVAWLKLKHIDVDAPIMQCTVVNNSIKRFVKSFSDLVTKDVERYHSINDVMHDLTSLIWQRVGTHITHISCLARACMITSRKDFHIPVITDPDDVMFGSLNRIIPMRSIGGLLAFQSYNLVTNKPVTYITPKRTGIFDEFVGYTDIIERDREWPVKTGSPITLEDA